MICARNCPVQAIEGSKRAVHVIDQHKCTKCGNCLDICPSKFSAVVKVTGKPLDNPEKPIPVASEA